MVGVGVRVHIWASPRDTHKEMELKQGSLSETQTPQKEVSMEVAGSFTLPLLQGISDYGLWTNCIGIPCNVSKNMRTPRANPSLTGPGSLEDGTKSWHFKQDCALSWPGNAVPHSLQLRMSPLVSSPGQRPQYANRFSKILNQSIIRHTPHFPGNEAEVQGNKTNLPKVTGESLPKFDLGWWQYLSFII